jgi:hypothetical protein
MGHHSEKLPMTDIDDVKHDINRAKELSDYDAVNVLWVALVKAANLNAGENEFLRMKTLIGKLSETDLRDVLTSAAVNRLLDLDPPLETVLVSPHEKLYPVATSKALACIRNDRDIDPRQAILHLGEILKRIRNKREHGFKSNKGPRDEEILSAARNILTSICALVGG